MSTEPDFIAALRAIATHPGARALADDAAVLEIGGETLVLTHDMMVEGVHWLPGQDPADVAWKLVAVNLSDLAAKGAQPLGVLLGYSLGFDDSRFLTGLGEVLERFQVPLLGGDTVAGGGHQAHGLTAIGRATSLPVPARSGARVGDGVWLSGAVGGAMLAFDALKEGDTADTTAYRRPVPRLSEGQALAPLVTAMMDVSDGLLLDALRLAEASGVTLSLHSAKIPLVSGVSNRGRADDALRWGDDYELLFTLPDGLQPPVAAYRVGEVRAQGPAALLLDGAPPASEKPLGYTHAAVQS